MKRHTAPAKGRIPLLIRVKWNVSCLECSAKVMELCNDHELRTPQLGDTEFMVPPKVYATWHCEHEKRPIVKSVYDQRPE